MKKVSALFLPAAQPYRILFDTEEVAMALLRRSVTAPASSMRGASGKSEIEVKQELVSPDQDEDYTPSLELQDAFRSLQQHPEGHSDDLPDFIDDEEHEIKPRVKIEEDEGYEPSAEWAQAFSSFDPSTVNSASEEYEPSECLLAALAELPQGMVDMTPTPMSPGDKVRVKPEPRDDVPFAARMFLLLRLIRKSLIGGGVDSEGAGEVDDACI